MASVSTAAPSGDRGFILFSDAIVVMQGQGRSKETVYKWFAHGKVSGYCDLATRQTFAWWPDLYRLHLTTPRHQPRRAA